jgi:predicted O-linked N-acetylglucosamine transferase (SPINDLY family)
LAAYDKALTSKPDLAAAWLGRGNICTERKRYDDALAAYDKALTSKRDFAEAWYGRGNVFTELKRYDDAFAAYDKALTSKPTLAEAWLGHANVWTERKRYDDALAAYDRALALKPDLNQAASLRLHAKLHICDWTNLEAEVEQLLSTIGERKLSNTPFSILALPSSAADQLQCARRYGQDQPIFPRIWRGEVYAHDRIRIAYLSADFREHPVASLTVGLFEQHDKSRFEITGISFGPGQNSTMRRRIEGAFEHFVDAQCQSDPDIADLIRRLEIDIAVDLNGLTADNRHNVLARRAAPIQVNYLGYPGTMGAGYIDYIVADPTIIPDEQRAFYTEQVVWLPESYQVNDNRRPVVEHAPTRRECGLPETAFVFCSFNGSYKITPEMFDIWMRLLKEVNSSVLWLKENDAVASHNLRIEAERRGVAPERLVFAPPVPLAADHLKRLRQADLFLDTLPYNAHTTASDALWSGVPVLTCLGATFAGRVAGSVLKSVGLDELVTSSLEEYEALALKLARDPFYLASIKDRLAHNRNTFPLFNTERGTRQMESAYMTMWERYQRGEMPSPIR